jgi:predicted anti-sigma-YlaC factor YlaD
VAEGADVGIAAGSASVDEDAHIRSCPQCRARYDALAGWLADARAEAIDEADDLFSAERLAAQHAQILRRLETLERPGRILAFPRFRHPGAPVRRGPQRWIAAAAVAAFIVGLGAGELLDFRRSMGRVASPGHLGSQTLTPLGQSARGALQPIALNSDDTFLYYDDSDAVSTSPSVEALQALDALTPRVRDLDQVR